MQRRTFVCSLPLLSTVLLGKTALPSPQQVRFATYRPLIAAVQEHMFPPHLPLPSATQVHTIDFVEQTLFHPSYDHEVRAYVIEGAATLHTREKHFVDYTPKEKERALRAYEAEGGAPWLSRILILTLEAMLSDPIYGSNPHKICWRALGTKGGKPNPKVRYIFS